MKGKNMKIVDVEETDDFVLIKVGEVKDKLTLMVYVLDQHYFIERLEMKSCTHSG